MFTIHRTTPNVSKWMWFFYILCFILFMSIKHKNFAVNVIVEKSYICLFKKTCKYNVRKQNIHNKMWYDFLLDNTWQKNPELNNYPGIGMMDGLKNEQNSYSQLNWITPGLRPAYLECGGVKQVFGASYLPYFINRVSRVKHKLLNLRNEIYNFFYFINLM